MIMNALLRRMLIISGLVCFSTVAPVRAEDNWKASNSAGIDASKQMHFDAAEKLFRTGLKEAQKSGPDDPRVATSLNNLAANYYIERKDEQAEQLYKQALAIREKKLGQNHPDVAETLDDLGLIYFLQGKDTEAQALYKRALAIEEKALGPDQPNVGKTLNYLGLLYGEQKKYSDAEALFRRSLAINDKASATDPGELSRTLWYLADLYNKQGKHDKAKPLLARMAAIDKKQSAGPNPPRAVDFALMETAPSRRLESRNVQPPPRYGRGQ